MNKEQQELLDEDKNLEQNKSVTYTDHDCNDFRHIIYTNTKDYTMESCMICDTIVRFRWKSWIKRFKSIF